MNLKKRQIFWDTLCSLDGQNKQKDYEKLISTIQYPKNLCRFRSIDELSISALQENKLYFSSAKNYDDPFDSFLHIDWNIIKTQIYTIKQYINELPLPPFLNSFLNELMQNNHLIKFNEDNMLIQVVQKLNEKIRPELQEKSFSICFSEDYLNQNLWLKYAENHRGFCLVYDLSCKDDYTYNIKDITNNAFNSSPNYLFPIYYSNKPYDLTYYALAILIDKYLPCYAFDKNIELINSLLNKMVIYKHYIFSLIKNKCHKYDKEWRILPDCFSQNDQYRPIIWKPRKVIIGLRTPKHHINLIKHSAKIAGIENIYQATITPQDKLGIVRLDF